MFGLDYPIKSHDRENVSQSVGAKLGLRRAATEDTDLSFQPSFVVPQRAKRGRMRRILAVLKRCLDAAGTIHDQGISQTRSDEHSECVLPDDCCLSGLIINHNNPVMVLSNGRGCTRRRRCGGFITTAVLQDCGLVLAVERRSTSIRLVEAGCREQDVDACGRVGEAVELGRSGDGDGLQGVVGAAGGGGGGGAEGAGGAVYMLRTTQMLAELPNFAPACPTLILMPRSPCVYVWVKRGMENEWMGGRRRQRRGESEKEEFKTPT
ncbi:hypothetical protein C8J57DRAFT_1226880 [Mycena rebaudengoi]|nr:hypothetical protein C8J57DRAFT_1226880 [Mycena rebaudengoi]